VEDFTDDEDTFSTALLRNDLWEIQLPPEKN
jgi:hypothetical protein